MMGVLIVTNTDGEKKGYIITGDIPDVAPELGAVVIGKQGVVLARKEAGESEFVFLGDGQQA